MTVKPLSDAHVAAPRGALPHRRGDPARAGGVPALPRQGAPAEARFRRLREARATEEWFRGSKRRRADAERAGAIAEQTAALIDEQQRDILDLGAPARLLAEGLLEGVLGLDEEGALDDAGPVLSGRKLRLTPAAMREREDAMVHRLTGHALAVILLGGAHDITPSVKALAPEAEYVRVTLRAYQAAAK